MHICPNELSVLYSFLVYPEMYTSYLNYLFGYTKFRCLKTAE